MKTILLPIYNGLRSRDFFRTDVYKDLVSDSDICLVVVCPSSKIEFYKSEFPEKNVIFEPLSFSENKWGKILNSISFNLLNTGTIKKKHYQIYVRDRNLPKYIFRRFAALLFGNSKVVRKFIRFLNDFIPLEPNVVEVLKKYKPKMVVVPDIVLFSDRIFLRAAKHTGIFVVGMVRSWDNLTAKGVIQVMPDKLIAQTDFMKRDAMRYGDMNEKDIEVLGLPQFDFYFRKINATKEEFLKNLGIPFGRRLILCAPFFDTYSTSSGIKIINQLARAVDSGKLPKDLHFLVRYRPESLPEDESGERLLKHPHITVTMPFSKHFGKGVDRRPDYEFSKSDVELLINSLYFSHVTINTISTLTVDAIVLDKPVINIRFDGDSKTPPAYRVALFSGYDHYNFIENLGGASLAYNFEELIELINKYLKDTSFSAEGRKKVKKELVGFTDGMSGNRFAECIKKYLRET